MADASQTTASSDPAAALASGALSGSWTLDPGRSSVALKTKAMWGVVPVKGTFSDLTGQATVTAEGAVSGHLEISSATINTKMKKRDDHLRSDDFFASQRFPHIRFEVDQVAPAAHGLSVSGRLTIRERTNAVSIPATVTELAPGEFSIDGVTQIDRSEFGLDYRAKGATKMNNDLTIHAVFTHTP